MSRTPFLHAAIEAAQAGEDVIKRYYQRNIGVELKADQTPLTVADLETEQVIRTILQNAFPEHGFYGEETGWETTNCEYVWLVDPIDGTKSFIRQIPFFSTQIALRKNAQFILGVSNSPPFGELTYAEVGTGAYLNNQPVQVSDIRDFAAATLSLGNMKSLANSQRWTALAKLITQFNRTRGYGDFYHYHLLAAGKLEVVIESDVSILDVAALNLIVQEAGGRVTDLQGQALNLDSTSILASNGHLHDRVLEALN